MTLLEDLVSSRADVPRSIRARAWSLLANLHQRWSLNRDGTSWNIDSLYRAARCANEACVLGFAPSGVLFVGVTIERIGFRGQEDCRHSTELFATASRRQAEG